LENGVVGLRVAWARKLYFRREGVAKTNVLRGLNSGLGTKLKILSSQYREVRTVKQFGTTFFKHLQDTMLDTVYMLRLRGKLEEANTKLGATSSNTRTLFECTPQLMDRRTGDPYNTCLNWAPKGLKQKGLGYSVTKDGYLRVYLGKGQYRKVGVKRLSQRLSVQPCVHQVVAWLAYGPCPDGYEVMHTCENRRCVNPFHLIFGSHLENLRHHHFPEDTFYDFQGRNAKVDEADEVEDNEDEEEEEVEDEVEDEEEDEEEVDELVEAFRDSLELAPPV